MSSDEPYDLLNNMKKGLEIANMFDDPELLISAAQRFGERMEKDAGLTNKNLMDTFNIISQFSSLFDNENCKQSKHFKIKIESLDEVHPYNMEMEIRTNKIVGNQLHLLESGDKKVVMFTNNDGFLSKTEAHMDQTLYDSMVTVFDKTKYDICKMISEILDIYLKKNDDDDNDDDNNTIEI